MTTSQLSLTANVRDISHLLDPNTPFLGFIRTDSNYRHFVNSIRMTNGYYVVLLKENNDVAVFDERSGHALLTACEADCVDHFGKDWGVLYRRRLLSIPLTHSIEGAVDVGRAVDLMIEEFCRNRHWKWDYLDSYIRLTCSDSQLSVVFSKDLQVVNTVHLQNGESVSVMRDVATLPQDFRVNLLIRAHTEQRSLAVHLEAKSTAERISKLLRYPDTWHYEGVSDDGDLRFITEGETFGFYAIAGRDTMRCVYHDPTYSQKPRKFHDAAMDNPCALLSETDQQRLLTCITVAVAKSILLQKTP